MAGSRPQDQGRTHRRKGAPGSDTTTLLAEYQAAMRRHLRAVLVELDGTPQPDGLHGPVPPKLPSTAERARLWDLAIKLARELGTEVDDRPDEEPGAQPVARSTRRRGRVDYGPD